jgi:hypothetical protein
MRICVLSHVTKNLSIQRGYFMFYGIVICDHQTPFLFSGYPVPPILSRFLFHPLHLILQAGGFIGSL